MVKNEADQKTFLLSGEFNSKLFDRFMAFIDEITEETRLTFIVLSPGGYDDTSRAMHDILEPWRRSGRLRTVCAGTCESAAAFFVISGSRGQRCMYRNALLGLHDCYIETDGDPGAMAAQIEYCRESNKIGHRLLARATRKPARYWRDALRGRSMVWFPAAAAKRASLVDIIL